MAKLSRLMLIPVGIFAGFVALAAVGLFRDTPDERPLARVGKAAPDLTPDRLGDLPLLPPLVEQLLQLLLAGLLLCR